MMRAFRLSGIRLGSFEPEQVLWHGEGPDPASWEDYVTHLQVRRRAADALWAEQQVSIIGLSQDLNQHTTPARVADIKAMLRHHGLDSLMLVPLGATDKAIGALWLYRREGRWTEYEQRMLQDIGRDLGRLFVNAQALKAEQRFAQQLQELESYKRTLISMISHELKTPLAGILGNAEFLADAESPADIRRSARAMARSASRMSGLVEELLLIARLDQPGQAAEARPVALTAVVREAIDLHRPMSSRAEVEVGLTSDDAVALGSRDDLMVLVTNLIGNAVKYSHPGGKVEVRIVCVEDHVLLEVSDRGIGMDPDDLERLFGEFQRGTDADTLARPGSGLGLAIVDRIVRNHGGTIQVESARGVGSTFRVLLPAAAR
jgi:signal transduction histidine kinase